MADPGTRRLTVSIDTAADDASSLEERIGALVLCWAHLRRAFAETAMAKNPGMTRDEAMALVPWDMRELAGDTDAEREAADAIRDAFKGARW